jgi:hypothetical protein
MNVNSFILVMRSSEEVWTIHLREKDQMAKILILYY